MNGVLMSYQVLARRFRPQSFDEVVGQEPVTRTLKNAVRQGRIAHAFLFAGPRGVGKTTTARILAKALNCESGPTPDPCNQCINCREITAGAAVDCVEIDGASHTGVEHVRDLQEQLIYQPVKGRYKVYTIDEVHMLSLSAFNALLKTLEEPPAKVVFILATTEPHKVPPTIHSRCQRYDFRRIGEQLLIERLRTIAQTEGAEMTPEALIAIAKAADGSLRDAQSLLDQLIAFGGGRVTAEVVAAVLGLPPAEVVRAVAEACLAGDAGKALELLGELMAKGGDLRSFVVDLLAHFRSLLVVKLIPRPGETFGIPQEGIEALQAQAARVTIPHLELLLRLLLDAEGEMRRALHPRFVLEMTLVRMAEAQGLVDLGGVIRRLEELETRLRGPSAPPEVQQGLFADSGPSLVRAIPPGASSSEGGETPRAEAEQRRTPEEGPGGALDTGADLQGKWREIRRRVEAKRRALGGLLVEAEVTLEGETLTLTFANGNHFSRSTLEDPEVRQLIATVASEVFGQRIRVDYRFLTAGRGKEPARTSPKNHPVVQGALEIFGGRIVDVHEGGTGPHRGEA
jgi:DNA polymerase-3 subunit gamma/tau